MTGRDTRRTTIRKFAMVVAVYGLCLPLTGVSAVVRPVADAARLGDIETVRQLLREGADVNTAQGDGMTALHWAAERGDVDLGAHERPRWQLLCEAG